jgi:hypothetical protein
LASLHHLPVETAIEKMRRLLRPGGRLIVLGLWTDNRTVPDHVLNIAAGVTNICLAAISRLLLPA